MGVVLSAPAAAARSMVIGRVLNDGWVLSSQDFKAGELITWAQSCIWSVGHSDLSETLLQKIDPHQAFACEMLGIPLEAYDKGNLVHYNLRQAAKPFNFSKPGGGGVPTIILQARKQGEDTPHPNGPSMVDNGKGDLVPGFKGLRFCTMMKGEYCGRNGMRRDWGKSARKITPTCAACLACGVELETAWKRKWREADRYFKFTSGCVDRGMIIDPKYLDLWPKWKETFAPWEQLEPQQIAQFYSGRIRKVGASAETPFCVISNTFFQGLLADITKLAHRQVTRESKDATYRVPSMLYANSLPSRYAGCQSPLFGSYIPIFAHDELIGEHPRSVGHEAATRIAEIMVDCMRFVCPDLAGACEAKPTLMNAWFKSADMVVHDDHVVPWVPGHDPKKCTECAAQKQREKAREAERAAA